MTVAVKEGVVQGVLANNDNIGTILMLLQGAKRIAVDTETTGLNVRNRVDYLMGVCVYTPDIAAYIPFRHKERNVSRRYFDHLWSILKDTPELDWHNMKYDFHSFATMGVDPLELRGKMFCSLLAATLYNEELFSKELDFLAKRYLKIGKYHGDEVKKMGLIYGFENMDPIAYRDYGPQDAYCTWGLRDYFEPRLAKEGTLEVLTETEIPFNKLLYKMEQRGVGVHEDFCRNKVRIGNARMATIRRQVGFDPASRNDLKEFILNRLKMPVLYHTKSCKLCENGVPVETHDGPPSFNKVAMNEYDDLLQLSNDPTARLVNEYRGWQKAVTSLYLPLIEKRGPDGRIRTEFNQHRTVTGRLSAANPNLQQVPRGSLNAWNGDAKAAFHSGRDGYKLIGWDYSQLELRFAATYGREAILLAEFSKDKSDVFSVLAKEIFGTVTPENRHTVKNCLVYPSLYGAGLRKIALGMGMSIAEAQPIYERYKDSISGITRVSEQVRELVKKRGWVRYYDGRLRHIRNPNDVHTRAWNSVLQGGSAQLVKQAMLRIERDIEDKDCQMVLAVHDEITFIIKEEKIATYEPRIVKAMTDWPKLQVNLAVEAHEWGK